MKEARHRRRPINFCEISPKKRWKNASAMRNWVQFPRAPHTRLSIAAHIVMLAVGRWREVIIRDLLGSSSNWTSELEAQWKIVSQKLRGRSHSGRYPTWIAGFHTLALMCMHSHTHKCHTRFKKRGGQDGSEGKGTYCKPGDLSLIPQTTWQKERSNYHKLSSEPHSHAMAQGMVGF